jgi:hypothetical protein
MLALMRCWSLLEPLLRIEYHLFFRLRICAVFVFYARNVETHRIDVSVAMYHLFTMIYVQNFIRSFSFAHAMRITFLLCSFSMRMRTVCVGAL